MPQKPIRLEQLGITLDDIAVHMQDRPIIKKEVVEKQTVKEIDVEAVKKLVAEEVAKQPTPKQEAVTKVVKEIDEQAVASLVAAEVQKHIPEEPKIVAPKPANLDEHKQWAKRDVDDVAATVRSKFITVVPGQEALYAEKVEEATDYIADGATDLSTFPLLRAEVNATGKSTDQVVDGILARKSQWISVNAQIEEIRLRAKMVIDSDEIALGDDIDDIKNQAIARLKEL